MDTNVELAKKLRLTEEEFHSIVEKLGRVPNFTELCCFSAMWSEHCSYKNSINQIKKLPRTGKSVLIAAGEENAGILDIGDGYGVVFKIESHNHPSALEPFQGAATGVGGIHRDIFTMGARPIAALNSLRFGTFDNNDVKKTTHLLDGIVRGIGFYGNCFGVPTVAGEVYFEKCYNENPLVNAMSVGVVHKDKIISATAKGIGNAVMILGSATGRDGIGGASFASANLTGESIKELPAVQVGDPFQEKKLLEACLELFDLCPIIGLQDMGAAGIICSSSEMSAKGGVGMDISLDKVPTRQHDMKGWEILLSESQERMLLVVENEYIDMVQTMFDKWDLNATVIGQTTYSGLLNFYHNKVLIASIPAEELVLGGGAPRYNRETSIPTYFDKINGFEIDKINDIENLNHSLLALTESMVQVPNISSKSWIIRQYDSMVGNANTSIYEASDATVIEDKHTGKGILVTTDCNSRYVYSNPYIGSMIAVFEAARNIISSGGVPLGITNCLNFGNPYNTEVYYQFVESIRGISDACNALSLPVTGGNVSFYNETQSGAVYPTPTIGMVGLLEDWNNKITIPFKKKGDIIFLLGKLVDDISCSEYLHHFYNFSHSPAPYFDLNEEIALHSFLLKTIPLHIYQSIHDVSEGGLMVALLEKSIQSGLGFDIPGLYYSNRHDSFWFGESQGRAVVSIKKENALDYISLLEGSQIPFLKLGSVTESDIYIQNFPFGKPDYWKGMMESSIGKLMGDN